LVEKPAIRDIEAAQEGYDEVFAGMSARSTGTFMKGAE
jgi:hypothetical protein